jgi:hypothetical protein
MNSGFQHVYISDNSHTLIASGKGGLGNTKFVAFEKLAWHNGCFFCAICKETMVGKGFIQVKKYIQQ